jgi:hypothetical protein
MNYNDWQQQSELSQKDIAFLLKKNNKAMTIYKGKMAYVDNPCFVENEEWANIEASRIGIDNRGEECFFLSISTPATFKVLFLFCSDGLPIDNSNLFYCYYVSTPFALGCSWIIYPQEEGEYLCSFEKRHIKPLEKISSIEDILLL